MRELQKFHERWPDQTRVVNGVLFKRKENSNRVKSLRPVLCVQLSFSKESKERFLAEYLELLRSLSLLSFPAWEKTDHLLTQFEGEVYDNGFYVIPNPFGGGDYPISWYRFKKSAYKFPRSRRLETTLHLKPAERENFLRYLKNIQASRKSVLGKYHNDGFLKTVGTLENNQATEKGHNCTSWLATAPLSEGRPFMEALGAAEGENVGTNPGWWFSFLLSATSAERVPFVVYWSPESWDKILTDVQPGQMIPWNYLRR